MAGTPDLKSRIFLRSKNWSSCRWIATDRHKQSQTETDNHRQTQTATEKNRQPHTDTGSYGRTQTATYRHMQPRSDTGSHKIFVSDINFSRPKIKM